MDDDQKHSVFTLLYAAVLIDGRVLRVEVDQFFIILEDFLRRVSFIETLNAKSYISTWFVQNFKDILGAMKSPERDEFLLGHIEKLKGYEHNQIVLDMMKQIANSDKEYHPLEKQLVEKASEIWGISPSL